MTQRIRVERIPVKGPNEFRCNMVDVEVYYSLGGMNYFTYREEPRGYWVSIQPINVDGYCTSFTAFSGIKCFLKEAKRFSQKVLDELANEPAIKERAIEFMQAHELERA